MYAIHYFDKRMGVRATLHTTQPTRDREALEREGHEILDMKRTHRTRSRLDEQHAAAWQQKNGRR